MTDSSFVQQEKVILDLLNQQTNIEDWWNTFIDNTPSWLKKAYGWVNPTIEQRAILDKTTLAFRELLPILCEYTIIDFSQKDSASRIKWDSSHINNIDASILPIDALSKCTFLPSVNAGKNILRLLNKFDHNSNFVVIDGWSMDIATNLYSAIADQGSILCNLYDSNFIRKKGFHARAPLFPC